MMKKSNFYIQYKFFCDNTSIHGFHHLQRTPRLLKPFWVIIILSMFICSVILIQRSIALYLTFHIAGSNPNVQLGYSSLHASKVVDGAKIFMETQKVCKTNSPTQYDNITVTDLVNMGILNGIKMLKLDSFRNIVKCWWVNEEIECKELFLNQELDQGNCFTFIPNIETAHYTQISDFSELFYGLNESMVKDRKVSNSGYKNGFRILLNVTQEEHCDTVNKYQGAGFKVIVHDPTNLRQLFWLSSSISLQPGFAINIVLKPTIFKRKTAQFGKCQLDLYEVADRKVYFRNLCIQRCAVQQVVKNCKCIPDLIIAEKSLSKNFGIDASSYMSCSTDQLSCAKEQEENIFNGDQMTKICSECLLPCYETSYNYLISQQTFPSNHLSSHFAAMFGKMNLSEIRRNFLLVNFFYESQTVATVIESRAFTMIDLFIYTGGVIGLFLGMSFLSFGDVFELMVSCLIIYIKNTLSHRTTKVIPLFTKKITTIEDGKCIYEAEQNNTNAGNEINICEEMK